MIRPFLAAALGLLPLVAPAAQTMRPDARPAGGTLRPTATGSAATLGLTLRAAEETGVENCPGFVTPAAPDAVVEWPGGDFRLTTIAEAFDATLVVSGPDGTWSCNDDTNGLTPVVDIRGAARGRYAVWIGAYSTDAGQQAVTLSAGGIPPPPVFNVTGVPAGGAVRVASGFEAENGSRALAAQAGGPDSVLETGIVSQMAEMEYCTGFVTSRTPSAAIDYSGQGTLAFMAAVASGTDAVDLTLAVHMPDGAWRCSDDFTGSDPAIGIESAAAGRYTVWVGTYAQDIGQTAATLTLSEMMPVMPDMPDMPDMPSMPYAEGTYMSLSVDEDPAVRLRVGDTGNDAVTGTTAVTPEGANPVAGQTCGGYLTAIPTASVEMSGAGPLGITASAEDGADLVLVVRTPDNHWFCSDDADGLNPGVQIGSADDPTAAAGTYLVWVGTFGDPNWMEGMDMTGMEGMEGMDSMADSTYDTMDMQPLGPTTVTVTAVRSEIVVSTPDFGMDDMGAARPDFTPGVYSGQDLQPDRPGTTLTLRDNTAEADVTAGGTLINPVDGDACAGFVDARPGLAFTAGDTPVSVSASSISEDLVMLVRTPSGGWLCSDDAQGTTSPRVVTAEAGRYAVWVGTFSRPTDPVTAHVTIAPGM